MDGEQDRREHRGREPRGLAREQADEQDGERDHPDPGESAGAEPAHRRPLVAPGAGAGDGAVRAELDRVRDDPDACDHEVGRHRQIGRDEHGKPGREQGKVDVAKRAGHAG
jgi:hypothetical protein